MYYPVQMKIEDGIYHGTCIDIPELTAESESRLGMIQELKEMLPSVLETAYRRKRRIIPLPSSIDSEIFMSVPIIIQAKIILSNSMIKQRYRMTDLSEMIGIAVSQVQRIIDFTKSARLDSVESALRAVGISVSLVAESNKTF